MAKKTIFYNYPKPETAGEGGGGGSSIINKIFFVFELLVFYVLYCHKMSVKGMIEEIYERAYLPS